LSEPASTLWDVSDPDCDPALADSLPHEATEFPGDVLGDQHHRARDLKMRQIIDLIVGQVCLSGGSHLRTYRGDSG
jgi:hypothetical protein